MLCGSGGLVSLAGSNSVQELLERAKQGDRACERIIYAMAYNVAKEIGAMAAVLGGRVDAILITGGIAYQRHGLRRDPRTRFLYRSGRGDSR